MATRYIIWNSPRDCRAEDLKNKRRHLETQTRVMFYTCALVSFTNQLPTIYRR